MDNLRCILLCALSSLCQAHQPPFLMPIVEKKWKVGPTGWQISHKHPLAAFLSIFLILLVTYFVEKRTRHGTGRRNRPFFHLLLCGHVFAALFILHNYLKQY